MNKPTGIRTLITILTALFLAFGLTTFTATPAQADECPPALCQPEPCPPAQCPEPEPEPCIPALCPQPEPQPCSPSTPPAESAATGVVRDAAIKKLQRKIARQQATIERLRDKLRSQ